MQSATVSRVPIEIINTRANFIYFTGWYIVGTKNIFQLNMNIILPVDQSL